MVFDTTDDSSDGPMTRTGTIVSFIRTHATGMSVASVPEPTRVYSSTRAELPLTEFYVIADRAAVVGNPVSLQANPFADITGNSISKAAMKFLGVVPGVYDLVEDKIQNLWVPKVQGTDEIDIVNINI